MSDDIRIIKTDLLTPVQKEWLKGAPVLDPDTLDAAIIGTLETPSGYAAVYDYEKLIAVFLANDPTQQWDDAVDWISYNTIRALPYMGSRAPWILEEATVEYSYNEEDEPLIKFNNKKWWRHH